MKPYLGPQKWIEPLDPKHPITAYEIAARALAVNDGRVLLGFEESTQCWFTPGGRIALGEGLEAGLMRELDEETGLAFHIGRLVASFDVLMPRVGYTAHKFEFIFAATPVVAPDFIERLHTDGDQSGTPITRLRWVTPTEAKNLPKVFPEFLRNWQSLL
jgi:ADP-ribose pyrophosphatase YjhB (NUDIX family)